MSRRKQPRESWPRWRPIDYPITARRRAGAPFIEQINPELDPAAPGNVTRDKMRPALSVVTVEVWSAE